METSETNPQTLGAVGIQGFPKWKHSGNKWKHFSAQNPVSLGAVGTQKLCEVETTYFSS